MPGSTVRIMRDSTARISVEELIATRNAQYADAWRRTGELIERLADDVAALLVRFPQGFYNWIIILNKLLRILGDPKHIDSWKDIAGYATLVVDYLEKEKSNEVPTGRS